MTIGTVDLNFTVWNMALHVVDALERLDLPEGLRIRPIDWSNDLQAISTLPQGEDTIVPNYHLVPVEDEGMSLILEGPEGIIGQVSVSIEMEEWGDCDMEIDAIFIRPERRGQGLGLLLADSARSVIELWRSRDILQGETASPIEVSGDTLPGTGGERIVEIVAERALHLEEDEPSRPNL
ncbi:MAG: hypothetical protein ABJN42_12305 [Roseibium sp.]|uniref:hypothetical protein n=1 Tax=Roseibium sp. TaxID=1936156 RepID=UPI003298B08D